MLEGYKVSFSHLKAPRIPKGMIVGLGNYSRYKVHAFDDLCKHCSIYSSK